MASKKISLGLQGGGTYGAYTWGVLDRLLQEERLEIVALSGASAGAINAAVVADGMAHGGGRAGARRALDRFWHALAGTAMFSPLQRTPADHLAGGFTMRHSPAYQLLEMAGALAAGAAGGSRRRRPAGGPDQSGGAQGGRAQHGRHQQPRQRDCLQHQLPAPN